MSRIDLDGVTHPEESDPFDAASMYHIGNCAECRERYPTTAQMDDQIREQNPDGYAKMRARVEGR